MRKKGTLMQQVTCWFQGKSVFSENGVKMMSTLSCDAILPTKIPANIKQSHDDMHYGTSLAPLSLQ
jgi:hypothetical protein